MNSPERKSTLLGKTQERKLTDTNLPQVTIFNFEPCKDASYVTISKQAVWGNSPATLSNCANSTGPSELSLGLHGKDLCSRKDLLFTQQHSWSLSIMSLFCGCTFKKCFILPLTQTGKQWKYFDHIYIITTTQTTVISVKRTSEDTKGCTSGMTDVDQTGYHSQNKSEIIHLGMLGSEIISLKVSA